MYSMTVLTCSPIITMVPREAAVKRNIIVALQERGISVGLDEQRDFVLATKNVNVPACILSAALNQAGLDEVGYSNQSIHITI